MNFQHKIVFVMILLYCIPYNNAKTKTKSVIDNITDPKNFKKLLRTKTNILVCFFMPSKDSSNSIKVFKDAAESIKGEGTMVLVDCSGEAKKMCKKLKVDPSPILMKHYKDGEFNKDYDRKETVNSMLNFMRDPTGDIPWEEDSSANDVLHIPDAGSLAKLIRREQKPLMVMFYAPWCGFCKTLKPEYAAAATELKGDSVLAAIDVNRPENSVIRTNYNITGFPTMLYYFNGHMKYQYEGENTRSAISAFMKDPRAPPPKPKDIPWNETQSDVVHLSSENFDTVLKKHNSVLIMFYAPWCGHCKRMKPEYEKAAATLNLREIAGVLAAVDATKEPSLASRFNVKGYPTVKYFSHGDFQFDVDLRESGKIIDFMRDPQEPPPPPPPEVPWSEEQSEVVHLDEENYKPFLKKKKHVLVMFYAPWCGHCKRVKPEFTKAASYFKNDPRTAFVAIDCTTRQPLCSVDEVTGYPTLKYFSYLNKVVKSYTGGRTANDFISFMSNPDKAGSSPPGKVKSAGTPKSQDKAVESPKRDSASSGTRENQVLDDKESPKRNSASSGIKENKVLEDTLVLTNDNFKNTIASKHPTLVFFFATWCGACNALKPIYKASARELAGKSSLRFALFDVTDGSDFIDEYDIAHFPTIKLFQDGKFKRDYDGKRTQEDFKAFVEKLSIVKDEL